MCQKLTCTNCTNHGDGAATTHCIELFADRVMNTWNNLPPTATFSSLASVDFSEYLRCY